MSKKWVIIIAGLVMWAVSVTVMMAQENVGMQETINQALEGVEQMRGAGQTGRSGELDGPEGLKEDPEGELQAEALKEVTRYYARWSPSAHDGYIRVYWSGGSKGISITNTEEFQTMVDLLRNEKPISYNDASDSIRTTSSEPVGEGE